MGGDDKGDPSPMLFWLFARKHPGSLMFAVMLASVPSAVLVLALVLNHGDITTLESLVPHNGFHSGPEGRGTLSLVWSCISTIFTLIYVSVHLDIPNEHEAAASSNCVFAALRSIWRSVRSNLPLIFWMLINIFAPAVLVLVASMEYQSARDGVAFMRTYTEQKQHGEEGCRWTMRHAFFADMGGFELKGKPLLIGRNFYKHVRDDNIHLDYDKIEAEIRDRSNKNTVLKVFTFFQASWFIAQTIVRGVERRAVSQLEVTTCAYIFSLMAAYLFWIRKPYHINGRIPLESYTLNKPEKQMAEKQCQWPTPPPPPSSPLPPLNPNLSAPDGPADSRPAGSEEDVEIGSASPRQQRPSRRPFIRKSSSWMAQSYRATIHPILSFCRKLFVPLPDMVEPPNPIFKDAKFSPFNRAVYHPDRAWAYSCFTSGIVGTLIGLIHLLPFWNWNYINPMGQLLWRVCGIIQVVLPLGLAVNSILERVMPKGCLLPLWIGMIVMSFAYCVSRLVIFVLIWYSFASLPDAVYDSIDWSWFPHWY